MNKVLNKVLVKAIVRGDDGSVDVEATRTKYGEALLTQYQEGLKAADKRLTEELTASNQGFDDDLVVFIAERDHWDTMVGPAIHAVFDRVAGGTTASPTIAKTLLEHQTLQIMTELKQVTAANFVQAREMLNAYISDNKGTPDSGAQFNVAKGRDGGVKRLRNPYAVDTE